MGAGVTPGTGTLGVETGAGVGAETGVAVLAAGMEGDIAGVCIDVTVEASSAACETTGVAVTGTLLNALRKASAVWKRSAGSLAIDIRIISFSAAGNPGCNSTGGFGASLTCAAIME